MASSLPTPDLFGVIIGADTDREAQRRTGSYSTSDWLQLTAEAAEVEQRLAALLAAGAAADGAAARAAAEAHRQHITRWFYDCSYELHRGLAEMYLTDERFCEHFDRVAPGLAQYVHDAMLANACPTLPVQDERSTAILRLPLLVALVATLVGGCGDDSDGSAREAGNSPRAAS